MNPSTEFVDNNETTIGVINAMVNLATKFADDGETTIGEINAMVNPTINESDS